MTAVEERPLKARAFLAQAAASSGSFILHYRGRDDLPIAT